MRKSSHSMASPILMMSSRVIEGRKSTITRDRRHGSPTIGCFQMKTGKYIERAAKSLFFAPKVLLRYGTLSPTKVRLNGCGNWIHIDPNDRRAASLSHSSKFVAMPISPCPRPRTNASTPTSCSARMVPKPTVGFQATGLSAKIYKSSQRR
jgi:hypothetical protein